MSINGTCPDEDGETACAANAVGLVFNLAWVLNNAAQIPAWCTRNYTNNTMSQATVCLSNMALLLASSLQIVSDGIAAVPDCEYLILGV